MMSKRLLIATSAAALALAGQLVAGGFYLQLGNPEASAEARKVNAVVTVKATGCHDPNAATLTATATGIVNGERRTIPLKVEKLSEQGMFAIAQQWPKEGRWVIQVNGRNAGMSTNVIVTAGPNGVDRTHAKYQMTREFTSSDVDALLTALP